MKKIALLPFIALSLLSCKNDKKEDEFSASEAKTVAEKVAIPKITSKTYAEISVKEGGQWQDRKYVNGSHFKNVTELQLPKEHTDHSFYIRYEGPGWENAQIGYRLYLDWRNAIDIFGKKTDSIVLPYVGQDGFDSYHEPAPWGLDVLKAGKSMGIGGFGRVVADTVVHFQSVEKTFAKVDNANENSSITIQYNGWKSGNETINLQARLTIFPNDRFTKAELTPSQEIEGLCTGVVLAKDIPRFKRTGQKWGLIASYGKQSLAKPSDNLGLALFYKLDEVFEQKAGKDDNLVIFKPTTKTITYYFLGAWEQEPNGIKTKEAFLEYIDAKLEALEQNDFLN
ncbi:MAG: DUF4861 family protein [Flavobacteriaceae bacterium]